MRDVGEIAARIDETRERIARAADRVGRNAAEIRLIGAAKGMPSPLVAAAVAAGLTDVGQNYVQEALSVKAELEADAPSFAPQVPVRWHLIGRLQRNKVARAAALFDVVQTIDRLEIGAALARHAVDRSVVLSVMVEVNLAAEPTKSGVAPTVLPELLAALRREPALSVDGLMAIPPAAESAEDSRRHFQRLRHLRDEHQLAELSMGMSDDFEIAIEEGATMVRIGRAIFGERRRA